MYDGAQCRCSRSTQTWPTNKCSHLTKRKTMALLGRSVSLFERVSLWHFQTLYITRPLKQEIHRNQGSLARPFEYFTKKSGKFERSQNSKTTNLSTPSWDDHFIVCVPVKHYWTGWTGYSFCLQTISPCLFHVHSLQLSVRRVCFTYIPTRLLHSCITH